MDFSCEQQVGPGIRIGDRYVLDRVEPCFASPIALIADEPRHRVLGPAVEPERAGAHRLLIQGRVLEGGLEPCFGGHPGQLRGRAEVRPRVKEVEPDRVTVQDLEGSLGRVERLDGQSDQRIVSLDLSAVDDVRCCHLVAVVEHDSFTKLVGPGGVILIVFERLSEARNADSVCRTGREGVKDGSSHHIPGSRDRRRGWVETVDIGFDGVAEGPSPLRLGCRYDEVALAERPATRGVLVDDVRERSVDVTGVAVADHGDLLRTTVTEPVARQQAGEALVVPDVAQVLTYPGPVDDQRAVVVVAGSLDGVEQQRRGVEGMCPERSRRLLAILHDVQRGERLRGRPDNPLVPVGAVAQVRTREVHALGLRNRHVVRVQQAISSHHRDALKAGHVAGLLDDEVAFRLEDREEQQLRRTRRNLGQHRNHVGVALVDRRERRDRPPKSLKGIRERLSQPLGVRIAVMDRRRCGHAQRVNSKTSRCGALVQVVVRRAVVARVVVRTRRAGQVTGQRRAGVRR